MKKNNKGFTMLETLITSTLIISTLVFLYVQFNNLKRNYDDSFKFNTVEGIHKAKQLTKYYKAKSASCDYISAPCTISYADSVTDKFGIEGSILMSDLSSSTIDNEDLPSICGDDCKKFIKKLKRTDTTNPRLVVIYKDGTYASVLFE